MNTPCNCGQPWGAIIPPPPCPTHGKTVSDANWPYPQPGNPGIPWPGSPTPAGKPQVAKEGGCRPVSIGDAMRRIDELERRVKELEQD